MRQADKVTSEQKTMLLENGVFGNRSGQSVIHTLCFYKCKLFGMRGTDEHTSLYILINLPLDLMELVNTLNL